MSAGTSAWTPFGAHPSGRPRGRARLPPRRVQRVGPPRGRVPRAGGERGCALAPRSRHRPRQRRGADLDARDGNDPRYHRAQARGGAAAAADGELDHRVKNILANLSAVARLSSVRAASVKGFVEALDGRIQAMSRAHALLRQGNWNGADLADLARPPDAVPLADGAQHPDRRPAARIEPEERSGFRAPPARARDQRGQARRAVASGRRRRGLVDAKVRGGGGGVPVRVARGGWTACLSTAGTRIWTDGLAGGGFGIRREHRLPVS